MKIFNYLFHLPKKLKISVFLFIASFIAYFIVQIQYINAAKKNYIHSISNEVKLLINTKKEHTLQIAQRLAMDKKFITIMTNKEYEKLHNTKFFALQNKQKSYKNLWLHVVDENGINRYTSWSKKAKKSYVLDRRADLKKLYKNPHPVSTISVGIFDITFKDIVPIYDETHKFLGIVEIIGHFNSISRSLEKDKIYSAVVASKRFTNQITHPFSKTFIDGYYISTLKLNKDVKKILKANGVDYFINTKEYIKADNGFFGKDYFVTKVPIKGVENSVIGYYLIFIKDNKTIEIQEILLKSLSILMGIFFLMMTYFGGKVNRKNTIINKNLEKRIEVEVAKSKENEKHLYEQAKMAQMGEMIGNIAHQWRQPLSVISTAASGTLMQKEYGVLKEGELEKNLELIDTTSQHLSKTIDTFRDYIKEKKEYKEVILQERIKKSLDLISAALHSHYIELTHNLDEIEPIKIHLISGELSEVVINIINNAKDAFLDKDIEKKMINVTLGKSKNDQVSITIADNAGGIPEDILSKIFNPYFTTKHQSQGTGIGLYMSKDIIEKHHNGILKVKNKGSGALFTIVLPLKNRELEKII